ncbi:TRAP transporter substrate-binding protein [Uliginosibacterium sp. 31-16]|uniref:TRAP transporter substrate-binding protein n=1 Tax=Uliginosibacterium sp. 31-16 TaxID=3068315 RepID=UPI00273DBA73|nr:TRAP transporter substrate-binding protein [Uliginosibacterium sp. 31-16]MDP5241041.1 TRAP transporter substrate-binding protein [Uliginosibacterium sp. 31-16]
MRQATQAIAAALLALGCMHSALAQQKIELRAADYWDDEYPTVRGMKKFAELLSQRTNGRITMKVFSSGALGTEKETLEQVKVGALDLVRVNISPMNNICQETLVPTLPFLFNSIDHMHKALDSAIGDEILASCEPNGYVGLAFYDSGARSIYTKKPVRNIADMKGVKLRVQQSDLWVSLAGAMGANATPMPMGEVYTAFKTGLVDAAENNIPSYESSKHFEVVKYYSKTEHSMAPEVVMYSKRMWDKLSPEDRKIIRQAAKDSVPFQRQYWAERDAASLKIVLDGGAQIVSDVNKKSFQDAMGPVYAKFVTTPKLKELVKRVQDIK